MLKRANSGPFSTKTRDSSRSVPKVKPWLRRAVGGRGGRIAQAVPRRIGDGRAPGRLGEAISGAFPAAALWTCPGSLVFVIRSSFRFSFSLIAMNAPLANFRASLPFRTPVLAVLLLFAGAFPPETVAITLTGSNGRAVEFHSIQTATPKGLTAQLVADGPIIGITWDKLDLKALERDHRTLHDAYLKAIEGATIDLGLEMAPPTAPGATGEAAKEPPPRYPGWIDVKVGGTEFMLQPPPGKARGILLLSLGDYGRAFEHLGGHDRGSGPWGEFQTKHDLALLSYQVDRGDRTMDPTVPDEFVFAEKGSGKVLEAAIKDLAAKTKNPELADLPIALYGSERTGAAFAYNFVQFRPERVLAAVVSKGAFYDAEPNPASARVPMLFIWGQYCNNHELWNSENHAKTVLAKAAALNPDWTDGREFRGRGEQNPVVEYFGKRYLLELVALRLPPEEAAPPPPAEEKPAEDPATSGKKEEGSEEEKNAPSAPALAALDRAKGLKGNLATGETLKITDPGAPLGEEETFLPSEAVAKLWKAFINGELEPPAPTQLQ